MAFAGARFAAAVLEAGFGSGKTSVEYSYVDLSADSAGGKEAASSIGTSDLPFFSVPVHLGKSGVEKILPIGKVNEYEQGLMGKAVQDLGGNISKGQQFVASSASL